MAVSVADKILIIEDDVDVLDTVARLLEAKGYSTVGALNGIQGIAAVQAQHPTLVIIDLFMPDKEGIETIIELRRLRPDLKIIAISGGGSLGNMELLEMAGKLGASAILAKPFEPDELLDTVRSVLYAQ